MVITKCFDVQLNLKYTLGYIAKQKRELLELEKHFEW